MLGRENRLTKKKDIEETIKNNPSFFAGFLGLKKNKNKLNNSRFAFIISRKVSPKAIVRNKTKRQLREIIRQNLPKIKPGYDIVFFTKKGVENQGFAELKKDVEKLLKKSKLI